MSAFRSSTNDTVRHFTPVHLNHPLGRPLHSSIPLILPNNMEYDPATNQVSERKGVERCGLYLAQDAVLLLKQIKKPLAVLSICGPYRTGKSYILSKMLGRPDAFALGHTTSACTHGIWMGTTVLESTDFTLILLDTEGIDSVDTTGANDAKILVTTILLSSYFIYNSQHVPKRSDLEKMSCFTELASGLLVRQGISGENQNIDFRDHFPHFLWLIRDVLQRITDEDGEDISPTQYLHDEVLCRSGIEDETELDTVAVSIQTHFPSIEAYTLPPPTADELKLQKIEIYESELSRRFLQQVSDLMHYLKQKVVPKHGFSLTSQVDGEALAVLAEQTVAILNQPNTVPCLDNIWTTVVDNICRKAISSHIENYKSEMSAFVISGPKEEEAIISKHYSILENAKTALKVEVGSLLSSDALSSSTLLHLQDLVVQLENELVQFREEEMSVGDQNQVCWLSVSGGILFQYMADNRKNADAYCKRLLNNLCSPVERKVKAAIEAHVETSYTFDDLTREMEEVKVKYQETAIGPTKWDVLRVKGDEMYSKKELFAKLDFYQEQKFEAASRKAEAEAETKRNEEKLKSISAQLEEEQQHHEWQAKEMEKQQSGELEKLEAANKRRLEEESRKQEELYRARMERESRNASDKLAKMEKEYRNRLESIQRFYDYRIQQREEEIRRAREARRNTAIAIGVTVGVRVLVGAAVVCGCVIQ